MHAAVAGALALVAAVAVGCSGSEPAGVQASPTVSADPTQAPVGRFETPSELGEALTDAALAAGTARGTLAARSVDGTVQAELAYEFDTDAVGIAAEASVVGPVTVDVGVVQSGDEVYLRVPPIYQLFTSAPWVRVPRGTDTELGQQVDALLEALAAEVPGTSLLDLDRRASDVDLQFLGDDTVATIPVERYEVSATVDDVVVTRTYWVDDDDLLRRLDTPADDPAAPEPALSTATYTEWGVPVIIDAPDPADVADLPDGFF